MANAQKRGFRFPWGSDVQGDASAPEDRADDAVDDATGAGFADRLSALDDDLGPGPFDLQPEEEPTVTQPADRWPDRDRRGADRPFTTAVDDGHPEAGPREPVAGAARAAGPASGVRSTSDEGPGSTASEASGPARATQPTPTGAPGPTPRRAANPLVAGLVKAMREAAQAARDEAVATLRTEAAAREESIRADATTMATQLRKTADDDVAGIREWSKAELARVRDETERRIAARREQLTAEAEAEAQATEATIQRLGEAVQAFEAETESFFAVLLAEDDPARLAGLAERMPQPPSLEGFAVGDLVDAGDTDAADARAAAGADAEAGDATSTAQPTSAADAPEAGADADAPAEDQADGVAEEAAADHLDADAAAAAEAAALDGLDGQTRLLVSGLDGMAAIAAFKGALLRLPGVSAVSVLATDGPELQFNVTHDADTDVRDGLRGLGGFHARVIADDGDSVAVVASAVAA